MPNENPQVVEITDARIAWVNQSVANFASSVELISNQLQAQAVAALGGLTPQTAAKAQAIVDLQKELQKQLNKLDYPGKIQSFIGTYDASQQAALDTLEAMDVKTDRLAPLNTKALLSLKKMDYKFLTDLGPAAISAVSHGVMQNTVMGTPKSRIIQNIQATLSGKFANQAATYADTALSAYDRRVTMETWQEAGLTQFKYRGPRDIKNRKFCSDRVGKVFSLAEIKAMNNGTRLMPVIVYGGGWNCRHVFTPVPQTPVERKPPGSASSAAQEHQAEDLGGGSLANLAGESLKAASGNAKALAEKAAFEAQAKAAAELAEAQALAQVEAAKAQALAAEQAAAAALALAAEKLAAIQAAEKAAALAAEQAAAKLAAEQAAAAKAAAENKILADAAKLTAAKNPSQLIEKGSGPEGKPNFTVQGKTYSSSGAAYKFAKKLYEAIHPPAPPAPAPEPAPAPAQATQPPAAPPAGMAAKYQVEGSQGETYTWNPKTGKYTSSAGTGLSEWPHATVKKWQDKGYIQADEIPGPAAAPATAHPTYKAGSAVFAWDEAQAAYTSPSWPGHQWPTPNYGWTLAEPPTPVAPAPAPAPKAAADAPAALGQKFTFEKKADVGGIHPKEFYRDQSGDRWLFKPVLNPNDKFMAYADEAAFKIQKAMRGDVVEVRAAEIDGKFGSIQKMETDLATHADFAKPGQPGKAMDLSKLSAGEIGQLQQEQVVDWMLANHDSHASQFLRTTQGTVYGIDKTQAWKWLGKDELSPSYWPNEHESIYNTLMRDAKAGAVKLDPAAALKAIKAAESITDSELLSYVKDYAEARFKSDPAARQKFYDALIERKNGLRTDFEKLYGDLLGQPGFKFEEKPKPSSRAKSAAKTTVANAAPGGHLDAANLARVGDAAKTGWQGVTLQVDKGDIEDQNVLLWGEKTAGGGDRTVLKFKLRPGAQPKVLDAMGVNGLKQNPGLGSGTVSLLNEMYSLVPKPASVVSKQIFEKLIQSHPVADWKFGWGGTMAPEQIATAKKQAADYLKAYAKAKRLAYSAQKAATAGPAPAAARDYDVKKVDFTLDKKTVTRGVIHVQEQDVPFGDVMGVYGKLPQINASWKDGMEVRFVPWAGDGEAAYAHQGSFEIRLPGKPDAAAVEKALQRLDAVGISGRSATALDAEKMYLEKQAYISKVHNEPEWKTLQSATASSTDEVKVERMRQFWSRRLGVQDVTALPYYKPEGEYQLQWDDYGRKAGQRLQYRFDISPEKLASDMKGYHLYHSVTYGGSNMNKFLPAMLDGNRALVATTEKLRSGVVKGGASADSDMGSGGANYVFTRIKAPTASGDGIYFKIGGLRRMDAISYDSDMFGRTTGKTPEESRASGTPQFKDYARNGSNETILKYNVNFLEQVDFIKSSGPSERADILRIFKARGITKTPDGRKIEDVVK